MMNLPTASWLNRDTVPLMPWILACLLMIGDTHVANAVEEPAYELMNTLGDIEIRRYQPSIQAVTALADSSASSSGFKRLAGFIFGGNDREMSIAMTAPVQETLGVPAPEMAFTMPSTYSMQELPAPNDRSVRLIPVPQRLLAVVSFSGWATEAKIADQLRDLEQALESHAITTVGPPMLNQYNPPWTLPFLRRNEVAVQIAGPSEAWRLENEAYAM